MNPGVSDSQIKDFTARPARYANIDGTGEIYVGALLGASAVNNFLRFRLPASSFWNDTGGGNFVLFYATWGIGLWLAWLATRWIKRRCTYPRTGYVAQRRPTKGREIDAALIAMIGAGIAWALAFFAESATAKRTVDFAFFAAPYAVLAGLQIRTHLWKAAIAVLLAGGLLAAMPEAPMSPTSPRCWPAMALSSAAWLVSGGITLLLYIRRTRAPEAEGE